MAKHIQKTDLDGTWVIDSSDDTWILTGKAKINALIGDGIFENSPYDNSTIRVLGDIKVHAGGASGVGFQGDNSSLYVGASSRIDATGSHSGVLMLGSDAELLNDGILLGKDYGVNATTGSVENNGTIKGETGVNFSMVDFDLVNRGLILGTTQEGVGGLLSASSIVNGKSGVIRSVTEIGIETDGAGEGSITNHGLIKAPGTAILDGVGDVRIINTGRIEGAVYMGDGKDSIDTRRGEITGAVHGEMGHDTYRIGKSHVEIVEAIGQGNDQVYAHASYTLTAFVEQLSLVGTKDIDGTGNVLGNIIYGNEAHNVLRGMDGDDRLLGGAGNDRLVGGDGVDTFEFGTGNDRDVITDFIDGADLISIEDINDEAGFLALDVSDVKGGVLIEYQGGEIFIKGISASDLSWQDDFVA